MILRLFVSLWLAFARAAEVGAPHPDQAGIPHFMCEQMFSNDNSPVELSQLERWLTSGESIHEQLLANELHNPNAYALLSINAQDLLELLTTGFLRQGKALSDETEFWPAVRPIQPLIINDTYFNSLRLAYEGSKFEAANYAFAGRILNKLGVHNAYIQQIAGAYFAAHLSSHQSIPDVLNRLEKGIFVALNEEYGLTQGKKAISPERERNIRTLETALNDLQDWRARFSNEQWHHAIEWGTPALGYIAVLKHQARAIPLTPHPALFGGYTYHVYNARGIPALQIEAIIPQGYVEKCELFVLRDLLREL